MRSVPTGHRSSQLGYIVALVAFAVFVVVADAFMRAMRSHRGAPLTVGLGLLTTGLFLGVTIYLSRRDRPPSVTSDICVVIGSRLTTTLTDSFFDMSALRVPL